jgi:hypothetical protein
MIHLSLTQDLELELPVDELDEIELEEPVEDEDDDELGGSTWHWSLTQEMVEPLATDFPSKLHWSLTQTTHFPFEQLLEFPPDTVMVDVDWAYTLYPLERRVTKSPKRVNFTNLIILIIFLFNWLWRDFSERHHHNSCVSL